MASKLGVSKLEDWYNITTTEFQKQGGRKILAHYGDSIAKMLAAVYPEYLIQSTIPRPFNLL
jgi:hypothetical protein